MPPLILALGSICLSVAAQFLFKAGTAAMANNVPRGPFAALQAALLNPWILAGFALYGVGAIVWLAVLARWDVSKAYPLVGAGFVMTLIVGLALGESVTPWRVAGVLCICVGVGIVSRT
jgi:drug/metabolite transporter (DMT)-like permease